MAEDGDDAHVRGLVFGHLGEGAQLLHDLTVLQVVPKGALQNKGTVTLSGSKLGEFCLSYALIWPVWV